MLAIVELVFRAGAAERKQQFLVITIRQDWMVELSWRQELTFDDADRVVFKVFEVFSDYGWVSKYKLFNETSYILTV